MNEADISDYKLYLAHTADIGFRLVRCISIKHHVFQILDKDIGWIGKYAHQPENAPPDLFKRIEHLKNLWFIHPTNIIRPFTHQDIVNTLTEHELRERLK